MLLSSQSSDFNISGSGIAPRPETLKQRCRRVFDFELGNTIAPENWEQVELQLGIVAEEFEVANSRDIEATQGGGSILTSPELQEARVELENTRAQMLEKLRLAEDLCHVFMRPDEAKERIKFFQRVAWSMPNP